MTEDRRNFATLLSDVRSGEPAAVEDLRQVSCELLRGEMADGPSAFPRPSNVAERVADQAIECIAQFRGSTRDEWHAWLRQRVPASPPPPVSHEEATLHRPAGDTEDQRPPVASNSFETLSRRRSPESSAAATPGGNAAPVVESEETLVKPASPDPDATLSVADRASAVQRAASQAGAARPVDSGQSVKPFGDYDLLSIIAKGGMGVVYKARQRKLNRLVAIKMILAGQFADSTDVERFYAEAEAAANLRHPNIVGIYEIGEVDGQHFFSMEYIEGDSLSDLARKSPLSPPQAAAYVKTIAEAMQFAHDHGILHRDLKPSNILIDESGKPLITDFGLAKRVESQSQLTMTGTVVGTPSYMPPEQAKGEIDKIGIHSDVYSTGAILYDLLTGVPPFRAASPFETIRQVLTIEPAAPRLVNPSIPKDLETICLKALQKDPSARYATEQEVADELGRFLAGEPILARPIGFTGRAWRWCRRNPVVASLGAAALTFLIAALVATTVGYIQTRNALQLAQESQQQSDESFRQARAAVDELFTRVSEDHLLNQPGMQPLRHDLLRQALVYYQKFIDQRGDDPTLRHELANTFYRVGVITEAIESPRAALAWFDKALAIQLEVTHRDPPLAAIQDLGDIWNALGRARHRLGDRSQALEAYHAAIDVRQQLVHLAPDEIEHARTLANSLMNVGIAEREGRQFDEARRQMQQAQRIRGEWLARHDGDAKLRRDYASGFFNLALLEGDAGNQTDAEMKFAAAQHEFARLVEDTPQDLTSQWGLVTCLRLRADLIARRLVDAASDERIGSEYQEVVDMYREAREGTYLLALRNPDVVEYQASLAGVLMNLGHFYRQFQQDQQAVDSFEEAKKVLEPLVQKAPSVARYRRDLAATQRELGSQYERLGQWEEAEANLAAARREFARLAEENPHDPSNPRELIICLRLEAALKASRLPDAADADLPLNAGYQEVVDLYGEARDRTRSLARSNPVVVEYRVWLAGILMDLGVVYQRFHQNPQALEAFEGARQVLESLLERAPATERYRRDLAWTRRELAAQYALAGRLDEAVWEIGQARDLFQQFIADSAEANETYAEELVLTDDTRDWIEQLRHPAAEPQGPAAAGPESDPRAPSKSDIDPEMPEAASLIPGGASPST